jgi:hypothetical protein
MPPRPKNIPALMYNAVEDTTARLAPRSVIHFVFSKILCLAECWTEAPPSPKTLKMGRRNIAVTMVEKAVSCRNKGVGQPQQGRVTDHGLNAAFYAREVRA